jgi:MATE family multidrug resistance protein
MKPPSYSEILSRAWPIILANASVPLLGLVDTAVIGNTGSAQQLGAIAMGALIFNFVYWSFGFLRMGTTGLTAQAAGARRWQEVRLVLGRALLISLVLAIIIVALHRLLGFVLFYLFQASAAVETQANAYFNIRIWGAPATLATFALMGTLVGLGKSKQLLWVQLFLNGLNTLLDIFFAAILGWGVEGIAWGTMISEYCTVIFAGFTVYQVLIQRGDSSKIFLRWRDLFERVALLKMINANRDIMIRTLLLVFSFAWFLNQSAQFGDNILAANHILLQFVSFSAFFLDGYAFVAESIVGRAIGARKLRHFDVGVFKTSILGSITAILLAATVYYGGDVFIAVLTDIASVSSLADDYLIIACLYIAFSVAAFQLDGIFIGAIRAAEMRNAAIISTAIFIVACEVLTRAYQNSGLWLAFTLYVIARAACLGYYFPRLRRGIL